MSDTKEIGMDWSIQQIARLAGTTSRTLRHYDDIGLLAPSRIGTGGYRYYDADALVELQRILLLRELGLGLPAIAEVMSGEREHTRALADHLRWLEREKERLERQISSVETTIRKLTEGEQLMANEMFEGFDHTRYREEVEQRWGTAAYADGDAWWRSKTDAEKKEWQAAQRALADDWIAAVGSDPAGALAQALAARQVAWLSEVPGTPGPTDDYLLGLGELYIADERFAANYGGREGATLVRDALRVWVANR